jgi:hypothetical protein
MPKSFAWSYTALTSFETCPRRHYLTRVTKTIVEKQSEQIVWGNTVHKALELRLKGEAGLPAVLSHMEPTVQNILSRPGNRLVEERLTINASFAPVSWRASDAWCRCVIDVGLLGTETAFLADWKTGKRKPDSDQLKLFAGVAFSTYPYLQNVTTAFIWTKENKLDADSFTREQVPEIWAEFIPRVDRLVMAIAEDKWPPRPSGLCGQWCPVTKKHCEFGRS